MEKTIQEINPDFVDMIGFFRKHPIVALQELLNVELAIPQQLVFLDMWNNNFVIITASRGSGKTYGLAAFASLKALLYPGRRIGLLSSSFRQSKFIFEEVKRIWLGAPLFREATVGKPTYQSDRCVLNFRSTGSVPPSLIEADPLGIGDKIRGARYHDILVDEFAKVPSDIFDAVIKPMAATSSSPMERVKQVRKLKYLKEAGISDDELNEQLSTNSIIMCSSAYFTFNHMYRRMQEYEQFIEQGKKGYAVRTITYLDMPDGFMNESIVEEARATMPGSLFRMEYLGIWEKDSDGVFKASLIEKCKLPAGDSVKLEGEPGKQYVVACDPARTSDYFSIVVIEVGSPHKIVNAMQFLGMKFPKMADKIQEVCSKYDVLRLVIDSQGGGHSLKDILADELKYGDKVIIDIDDEEYLEVSGNRILQLVKPSPTVNAETNWAALNLLEQGKLYFPGSPLTGNEDEEQAYETIQKMIVQIMTIVATPLRSGSIHFDVPSGDGKSKQKKDLYSAFIYAAKKIYDIEREKEVDSNVLWSTGVIKPIERGKTSSSREVIVSSYGALRKS